MSEADQSINPGSVLSGEALEARCARFIEDANRTAECVRACGGKLVAFADSSLPFFRPLMAECQNEVLRNLRALADTYCINRLPPLTELTPRDIAEHVAEFMDRAGLAVDPDFFRAIEENDYVDVYDIHHRLMYASLNFLGEISYSLEELICEPWYKLYTRDQQVVAPKLIEIAQQMVRGEHSQMVDLSYVESHIGYEARTKQRRAAAVIPRFIAPLLNNDRPVGYVDILKIKMIPGEFSWE